MASSLALNRAVGSSFLNKVFIPFRFAPSFARSFSADTETISHHDNGDDHALDVDRRRDTSVFRSRPDRGSLTLRDTSDVLLKIRVTRCEERDQFYEKTLPPYTSRVGLPESQSLYTVLRSPHVHKKSREQFKLETKKDLLIIKAQKHELQHKLFWLKRHRIFGSQFEIIVNYKTRMDRGKLSSLL